MNFVVAAPFFINIGPLLFEKKSLFGTRTFPPSPHPKNNRKNTQGEFSPVKTWFEVRTTTKRFTRINFVIAAPFFINIRPPLIEKNSLYATRTYPPSPHPKNNRKNTQGEFSPVKTWFEGRTTTKRFTR